MLKKEEFEGVTREQLHDMANIRGDMVLGAIAAQELIRKGKTVDDLQDLVHQYCDDWQELEQRERELW